ncbi:hypothetical protein [Isobaculum melis]|uniref:Uncharacterized protein n=1 Tax=Isobaculum melis TaxID=142588 RepID=A0A1H9U8R7_9LACT|nr:hypothetical protein [Isobaculum melis]SES05503.1 hypothetical protein SAMN04488559_12320 [Isobaculum melis]
MALLNYLEDFAKWLILLSSLYGFVTIHRKKVKLPKTIYLALLLILTAILLICTIDVIKGFLDGLS